MKFFAEVKKRIGWEINRVPNDPSVCHLCYVGDLLSKYKMNNFNATFSPMSIVPDIRPNLKDEEI